MRRAQERESHEESEWTRLRSGSQPTSQNWQELDVLAWLSLLTRTYTNIGTYHLSSALLSWIVEIVLSVMSGVPIHITCFRIQKNLIYQLSAKRQPRYSKKTALSCMHQVSNPPITLSLCLSPSLSLSPKSVQEKKTKEEKKGCSHLDYHVMLSSLPRVRR